ncbi:MAG: hypothetical protein V3V74_07860 [Nitrosomonadaceae bacterium]
MEKREELEMQLGQVMHKVGLHQNKVAEEQKELQKLQQHANDINDQLSKLDNAE